VHVCCEPAMCLKTMSWRRVEQETRMCTVCTTLGASSARKHWGCREKLDGCRSVQFIRVGAFKVPT
jgi:hypothetical protein